MHTIHDVARMAGVSIATVSAVLNKKGGVSAELTARVEKALAALDYQPHHLARGLKARRTNTIGIVIPDLTNTFFAEVVRGAEDEARARGYTMILCDSNEDESLERTNLDNLYSRRVDGVLLSPSHANAGLDRLAQKRFPIVFVDRITPGFQGLAVVSDNFEGAYRATKHLIGLGHKRIATIAGREEFCNAIDRLAGYRKALDEAGLAVLDEYVRRGDFQLESGYRCAMDLLRLAEPPTAIFSCSNKMTLGLMGAITELGLRCPENVSVLGFDDFDWAANFSPRLTTVAQPTHQMGREAMNMLLDEIQKRDRHEEGEESKIVTLQSELRIRNSTTAPS